MKRYTYNYQTIIRFSALVTRHLFRLRCIPCSNGSQCVCRQSIHLLPRTRFLEDYDTFGNRMQYGSIMEEHDAFVFASSGEVRVQGYRLPEVSPSAMYRVGSPLVQMSPQLWEFNRQLQQCMPQGTVRDKAAYLMDAVYGMMVYTPGATNVSTTAAQAYDMRKGVCQDYAHVLIALCRANGITARYVNGFLTGIGETHAWVEVYDGEAWIGLDPTHNTLIEYGYIKLSHGRDAGDCPVTRGVFMGMAVQTCEVRVVTEEI